MPGKSPLFKNRDICRAYRAVEAAGGKVASVRVDKDGAINIVVAQGQPEPATPFDTWKNAQHARSA